jgi:hypothetical protein
MPEGTACSQTAGRISPRQAARGHHQHDDMATAPGPRGSHVASRGLGQAQGQEACARPDWTVPPARRAAYVGSFPERVGVWAGQTEGQRKRLATPRQVTTMAEPRKLKDPRTGASLGLPMLGRLDTARHPASSLRRPVPPGAAP